MKIFNLINLEKSDVKYKRFAFPDGQDHINILEFADDTVAITTRLTNASDLFILLQATEVLRSFGVKNITLNISYLLSARMDRRMNPGEPITLKIVAGLINAQNYDFVTVFDPHSEVTTTLIDRSIALSNFRFIEKVMKKNFEVEVPFSDILLVAPDQGASKKIEKLASALVLDAVYCTKTRSTSNGNISNVKVDRDDLQGKDCLIVDDICDGGATFINLAKKLMEHNAGKLYLAVSHGIFSKGLDVLSDFEKIFTTNSFKDQVESNKLSTYRMIWD